jgi:hypothetical protein
MKKLIVFRVASSFAFFRKNFSTTFKTILLILIFLLPSRNNNNNILSILDIIEFCIFDETIKNTFTQKIPLSSISDMYNILHLLSIEFI